MPWILISAHRLKNVQIGVTQVSPEEQVPIMNPRNYQRCAFHEGNFRLAKHIFGCEPRIIWGRYVIIQQHNGLSGQDKILQLCEVEVYAGTTGTILINGVV